jgi:hypothetical protein
VDQQQSRKLLVWQQNHIPARVSHSAAANLAFSEWRAYSEAGLIATSDAERRAMRRKPGGRALRGTSAVGAGEMHEVFLLPPNSPAGCMGEASACCARGFRPELQTG